MRSSASFELIQKAAICGVPILAAVSRPTGLAVRMADAAGMGLVGLVRGQSANVYAHPSRIRPQSGEAESRDYAARSVAAPIPS